ncbi:hypothetical protein ACLB2K_071548 [Fragaria x ananassa]
MEEKVNYWWSTLTSPQSQRTLPMALLNVSMCSKIPNPSRQHLSLSGSPPPPPHVLKTPPEASRNLVVQIGDSICKACLIAAISASLLSASPVLAYIGGGPYGSEVTRGQDLSGKDFSGLTLVKQDFKTSILRQANFHSAKLLGASFFDADLTGADLSDADLRGADFSLANVTKPNCIIDLFLHPLVDSCVSGKVDLGFHCSTRPKVNLSNANLEGAFTTGNTSFKGSTITGADFTDVPLRDDQREYLCKIADGVNPTTGNETRDTLFCK